MKNEITASEVRKVFSYDPDTGDFRNRVDRRKAKKGEIAGVLHPDGYRRICYRKRNYGVHRLIWLYVYGQMPSQHIDHINGQTADNRITNLRLASAAENHWNMGKAKINTSGFKNVFWSKKDKKWFVSVTKERKRHYITGFQTAAEANEAAITLREKLHGQFAKG